MLLAPRLTGITGTVLTKTPTYEHPAELLAQLIRFDTTNPPGNERECIQFIESLVRTAGLEARTIAKDPQRPNLIARMPGRGAAPPLLLQGHVDVVTTESQQWSWHPFAGEIEDGWVHGRGALDMKGGLTMMLAALLRARATDVQPPGDLIFCALCDEEAMSAFGARFLVETHPELFESVRFALGEFGGASTETAGRRFYPIQVAEKEVCTVRVTVHGPAGHGSVPLHNGAMARLGQMLRTLDRKRLPVHVTPAARSWIEAVAESLAPPASFMIRALLRPRITDLVLDRLGTPGRVLDAAMHNTVNATVVRGGSKFNVIPGQVSIDLDGRLLPGQAPEQLIAELRALLGEDVELEVLVSEPPGPAAPDMGLFSVLASVLRDADPDGTPTPMLMPGVTDGRFFARLGIQSYGFTPMRLPSDFDFPSTIHAADERIPVEAVEFGTACMLRVLERFGEAT